MHIIFRHVSLICNVMIKYIYMCCVSLPSGATHGCTLKLSEFTLNQDHVEDIDTLHGGLRSYCILDAITISMIIYRSVKPQNEFTILINIEGFYMYSNWLRE